MLFAFSDPGLNFMAISSIIGVWAFYFFILREKPQNKGE